MGADRSTGQGVMHGVEFETNLRILCFADLFKKIIKDTWSQATLQRNTGSKGQKP